MKIIATSPEFQPAADAANALFDHWIKNDPQFMDRINTEASIPLKNHWKASLIVVLGIRDTPNLVLYR